MLNFWNQYKLRYLKSQGNLNFHSMRKANLPNKLIKRALLESLRQDLMHDYSL